ncbi:MAG: hypothetical protein KAV00_10480, partial [Phycisphaerae bacterium]|nr:hypothetical protein [Phycisphaerae bacterium]
VPTNLAPPTGIPLLTLDGEFVDLKGMGASPDDVLITRNSTVVITGHTLYQTATDIRLSNFTIKREGTLTQALYLAAIDNSASEYRYIRNYENNDRIGCGDGSIAGLWEFCTGGAFSWRLSASGTMSATMRYCTAGASSFGGDKSGIDIGGTFDHCTGGEESFGGCSVIGGSCSGTFYDCIAGDRSFAMNRTFSGKAYRCQGGADCFAGFVSGASSAEFSGYAEDCVATGRSFGSGHADSINSGRLVRCRCTDMPKPMYLTGAEIEDCVLEVTATGEHCLMLNDSACKILKSILLVLQGGTGIPVNAAAGQDVVVAHCLMNNATNDADGLGANAHNFIGTPHNVIDDQMSI